MLPKLQLVAVTCPGPSVDPAVAVTCPGHCIDYKLKPHICQLPSLPRRATLALFQAVSFMLFSGGDCDRVWIPAYKLLQPRASRRKLNCCHGRSAGNCMLSMCYV